MKTTDIRLKDILLFFDRKRQPKRFVVCGIGTMGVFFQKSNDRLHFQSITDFEKTKWVKVGVQK